MAGRPSINACRLDKAATSLNLTRSVVDPMLQRLEEKTDVKLERVAATGRMAVRRVDGRSRIFRLYQEGAAKIRMPWTAGDPLEAVLINTAGGLTGGDRIAWQAEVGAGASLSLTTQACEKIYRASTGHAEMTCSMAVGEGGRLAWLPQETILFDRSAFRRFLSLDLAGDAEALLVEATIFGRRAMGEVVSHAWFRDRWRIHRDGRPIHGEDFAIGPDVAGTLPRSAVTAGASAVATVLLISERAAFYLDDARAIVGERGGASAWTIAGAGKLLARLVDDDGYSLRKRLVPLIELLNGRAGLPKLWSL